MNTHIKNILLVLIALGIAVALLKYHVQTPAAKPVSVISYACVGTKTMTASYYAGAEKPSTDPKQAPTPGGSVALTLSDGRSMTLAQTLSADGLRFASPDGAFVFWSKGNIVLVLEDNQEKSYAGCIALAPSSAEQNFSRGYANSTAGFSLRFPEGYTVDETYQYQALGPGKAIRGVRFVIPQAAASSTNLAPDTFLSIEELPKATSCTANTFLPQKTAAHQVTDGPWSYSVASSTTAAAGNRYDELVFALSGTNPCVAIRYFVHYASIDNYPAGTVHPFDATKLFAEFDAIRHTLVVAQ